MSPRNKVTDARTPDTRCSRCRDREQGDELTRAHKLLSSTVCSADLRSVFETRCEAPPGAVRCVARELCRRLTPPSQITSGHYASGNGGGAGPGKRRRGNSRGEEGDAAIQPTSANGRCAPQRQGTAKKLGKKRDNAAIPARVQASPSMRGWSGRFRFPWACVLGAPLRPWGTTAGAAPPSVLLQKHRERIRSIATSTERIRSIATSTGSRVQRRVT